MKYKVQFLSLMLLGGLLIASSAWAQLPVVAYGKVLNPDSSEPGENEIVYFGYLTSDPVDSSKVDSCAAGGGWNIEITGFNDRKPDWKEGDTLVVIFKNISDGAFANVKSSLRYVTKGSDINFQEVGNSTLPVEMTTFVATARQTAIGGEVMLEWKTVGESNNLGFEVQRSTDRKTFERLEFVAGAGSTSDARSYSYVDKDVPVGIYYYRLKQIDSDGSSTFSDVNEVAMRPPDTFELSQNFPNPFNPRTEIIFQVKEESKVEIVVYDILGRAVATLVNEQLKPGVHRISFDGRELPSGMYLYSMKAGNFHTVKKMALIK